MDGAAALTEGVVVPYDVIILNVMRPARTGLEVASEWRARGIATPILMLTARDAIADRVAGLDAGADDYLIKPLGWMNCSRVSEPYWGVVRNSRIRCYK